MTDCFRAFVFWWLETPLRIGIASGFCGAAIVILAQWLASLIRSGVLQLRAALKGR